MSKIFIFFVTTINQVYYTIKCKKIVIVDKVRVFFYDGIDMNVVFVFLISILAGYYLSRIVSHPQRKYRLLPQIKYKNIEITPNVRIHFRSKTYWFHHWLYLSILIAVLFVAYDSFQHFMLVKGAALGGVFQGLRYPDRFKFRHPRQVI